MSTTHSPVGDARTEFRRMMTLIVAAAASLFAAAVWYMSLFMSLTAPMVGILALSVFVSVLLGCGLFAGAFFSNNSGLDQRVSDAAHLAPSREPNPLALPDSVVFQRRTMEFTDETLPAPLLKDHRTKAGTWALIHVLEGALQYDVTDDRRLSASVVLTAGGPPGIVEPTILHHIAPIGPVRFHVEFLRDADALAPAAMLRTPRPQGQNS